MSEPPRFGCQTDPSRDRNGRPWFEGPMAMAPARFDESRGLREGDRFRLGSQALGVDANARAHDSRQSSVTSPRSGERPGRNTAA